MNESPPVSLRPPSLNVELLENLIEELTNKLQAGEAVESEVYAGQYPELADQIRDLLPALRVLANASQHAGTPANGTLPGSPTLEAGILGDFRILREVGRGGMGVVYEAEQISLGRRVALKVLPFAATMDPRHLQRFQNEARAAASLEHPHIVPVYGVGSERGVHFYAMKFIDGQTLAALIHQQRAPETSEPRTERSGVSGSATAADKPLTPLRSVRGSDSTAAVACTERAPRDVAAFRQIAEWGIQAAEALEYAHSLGIVHRDIKPGNLMIDGRGKLWIADFGLARTGMDAGLTMTGDVLGTLRYMSPEQAAAQHGILDHRTDIYSLGATLYELLTLQAAFPSNDRQELLRQVMNEEPLPLRQVNRVVPAELDTIVLKAMAKDANERFATSRELTDDLHRWIVGKPVHARPVRQIDRVWRWCRRNKGMAGLTAAVLFLMLATIGSLLSGVLLLSLEKEETLKQKAEADIQRDLAVEREVLLRRQLYPSDMNLAFHCWERLHIDWVRKLLDRHVPNEGEDDQRGFEWHLIDQMVKDSTNPLFTLSHGSKVYGLAFSPDGKTMASVGEGSVIRIWDLESGKERAHWTGHDHDIDVGTVVFSPDGKTLATGSDDRTIKLWDIPTLELRGTLRGHLGCVDRLIFSPDSRFLVSAGKDLYVRIWHVREMREWDSLPLKNWISDIALTPDGSSLAIADHSSILLFWDHPFAETSPNQVKPLTRSITCESSIDCLAFNHRGDTLALGNSWGSPIMLLNTSSGNWRPLSVAGWSGEIAFSPDDCYLAILTEPALMQLWNLPSQSYSALFKERGAGNIDGVSFSPDGKLLATGSWNGKIYLWDLHKTHSHASLPVLSNPCHEILFCQAGSAIVAVSKDGTVRVLEGDKTVWRASYQLPKGDWKALSCTRNQDTWAFIDREGRLYVWEPKQNQPPRLLSIPENASGSLAFSPDGRYLVYGGFSGGILKYDLVKGSVSLTNQNIKLQSLVGCLRFSADGSSLAVYREHGECSVLAFPSGEVRFDIGPLLRMQNQFSPDGSLVVFRIGDHLCTIREAANGNVVSTLASDRSFLDGFAFAPDNRTLISTSEGGTLQVWNVATGQELFKLHVDRDVTLQHVAFSSDGKKLYAGGWAKDQFKSFMWQLHPEAKGDP
jgi:WD40 repeat protein/serine/threonine protein kinase